ncbi:zinc finger protein 33B-like [Acyrthosiphon pisum]|uniref:C2H2-type domain-containing protein n=1 Tax=Acyrthosiphon pisum TaxID=7029 RepID=A0A8R2JS24_ACYPI|nr:zinc finger protein 33B-like [Acyrthosiphon pisum]|eukprot:XP_008182702.1 PREDICTED: zinc finger protein 33B-like [Acyrthosiphon pisum]
MSRIPSIKCEPQNILLDKYIKQEHDIAHEHNIKQEHDIAHEHNITLEHDIVQEHNIKHEHIDEFTEYKLDYNGYYNQSTYQCYKEDSKNTKENVEVLIKFEMDVIDDVILYENICMRDDSDLPSVSSTKYCIINSHVENKHTNFNLNIESSSTATFTPIKNKAMKSKKNDQIQNEVHAIDSAIFESFVNHDNNCIPSAKSRTYYDMNPHVENKPTNFNLNIKASTTHFKPTKSKAITSKNVEKLHECFIYNKSFSTNGYMQIHSRIHTGEKPYQCFICNKSFTQSSNLNTHKIIHKYNKPFNCAICKKSFAQKVHILRHMNTHKTLL